MATVYLSDDVAVFCVNLRQGTELLTTFEDFIHFGVVQHEHVLVGHEHLERIDAFRQSEQKRSHQLVYLIITGMFIASQRTHRLQ